MSCILSSTSKVIVSALAIFASGVNDVFHGRNPFCGKQVTYNKFVNRFQANASSDRHQQLNSSVEKLREKEKNQTENEGISDKKQNSSVDWKRFFAQGLTVDHVFGRIHGD